MKKIEITGQRFGRLTAMRFSGLTASKRSKWLFICDCGKYCEYPAQYVRAGHTQSCGCLRKEMAIPRRLKYGEASLRILFCKYRNLAGVRNLPFVLTIDKFKTLTSSPCHYCGALPSRIMARKMNYGGYCWNGVDRMNNALGYTDANCVACCTICNYAKNKFSYDEFIQWIQNLIVNKGDFYLKSFLSDDARRNALGVPDNVAVA